MGILVEYLEEEGLALGLVTASEPKRLSLTDERGRQTRLAPDKVLFRHAGDSITKLVAQLEALAAEVDVRLLWDAVQEERAGEAHEPEALARLYFDVDDPAHSSAVYRALAAERLHFRRKGRGFEARSAAEVESLEAQRELERRTAQELAELTRALRGKRVDAALCERLEAFLRGATDRPLQQALSQLSGEPSAYAFELLLASGHLGQAADLEVLQANLRPEPAPSALAYVEALVPLPLVEPVVRAAFSIDDPDTREVDDALSATAEGDLVRVTIDIADAARLVAPGDPTDVEARRRATSVYLPTGTFYMLPPRLGCNLGSLEVDTPRGALRTTAWIDPTGEVQRVELSRVAIRVGARLDYDAADALLAGPQTDATGAELALLHRAALLLQARRRAAGALLLRRNEWKLKVSPDGSAIDVRPIEPDSPSRALVAEYMILANHLAAKRAQEAGVPLIHRVQPPPLEGAPAVDPQDPAALARLKGFLRPASLSLNPAPHWGLGVAAYSQVSSPLRRYGDLVQQRQLCALVAGEAPPYDAKALLEVLATVEATELEMKRVESAVTQRWALEVVARARRDEPQPARVVGEAGGGARVELLSCGAQGLLTGPGALPVGTELRVLVEKVNPRRGTLRVRPA
ncbi:MAG: RNB domain-containing ribonuclease [Deltaproteobacteria bacterium]|nr:RNB domain-containing ribonuclease [Deltaproteobacteria bacterium]